MQVSPNYEQMFKKIIFVANGILSSDLIDVRSILVYLLLIEFLLDNKSIKITNVEVIIGG